MNETEAKITFKNSVFWLSRKPGNRKKKDFIIFFLKVFENLGTPILNTPLRVKLRKKCSFLLPDSFGDDFDICFCLPANPE
jgi:hypothetical protein